MSYPEGSRRGVRRGPYRNGNLIINGHERINPDTRAKILEVLAGTPRPMCADEVGTVLNYAPLYMRKVMRGLALDGDVAVVVSAIAAYPAVYGLPGVTYDDASEARRVCTRCARKLPVSMFGADRSQASGRRPDCRDCRSPRPERQPTTAGKAGGEL